MASERQIAANRRNGAKSTGPKTTVGKRRSGANALRHGLARRLALDQFDGIIALAQQIAGEGADSKILDRAIVLVETHFSLLRIREVKVDLFQRMYVAGRLGPRPTATWKDIKLLLKQSPEELLRPLEPLDPDMPLSKDERATEALRRLLPELRVMERYERRAFSAKCRALREFRGVWSVR